jgi:hypothetical protein
VNSFSPSDNCVLVRGAKEAFELDFCASKACVNKRELESLDPDLVLGWRHQGLLSQTRLL